MPGFIYQWLRSLCQETSISLFINAKITWRLTWEITKSPLVSLLSHDRSWLGWFGVLQTLWTPPYIYIYIYIAIQHPIELRMERDDIESYKINENHVYIYIYIHMYMEVSNPCGLTCFNRWLGDHDFRKPQKNIRVNNRVRVLSPNYLDDWGQQIWLGLKNYQSSNYYYSRIVSQHKYRTIDMDLDGG